MIQNVQLVDLNALVLVAHLIYSLSIDSSCTAELGNYHVHLTLFENESIIDINYPDLLALDLG